MKHFENKFIKHDPEKLFNLVCDVQKYPEFLPWCLGSRVKKLNENNFDADLIVGFKIYREVFKSKVILDREKLKINVQYIDGPLKHLNNHWHFKKSKNGCEVFFLVDLKFNTKILNKVLDTFFREATQKMVMAFENRAKTLYG